MERGYLDLGGERMCLLEIGGGWYRLSRALAVATDPETAAAVLFEAAAAGCGRFMDATLERLAGESPETIIRYALGAYTEAGFGDFTITTLDTRRGHLEVTATNAFEAWATLVNHEFPDEGICHYSRGVIQTFLARATGRQRLWSLEPECQAKGDARCRLLFGPRQWLESLGQAVVPLRPAVRRRVQGLRRLHQRERELGQQKEAFVSQLAHELKTPFMILKGYCRLVGAEVQRLNEPRLLDLVEKSSRSLEKLGRTLDAVTRYSALGRPEVPSRQPVALGPVLEEGLAQVALFLEEGGLRVATSGFSDLPPVAGDPDALEEVFVNLLLNAARFSPARETIQVRAHRGEGMVECSVADRGFGIAPDDLDRIFEPFVTQGTPQDWCQGWKEARGSGLGLAICQRIVTGFGGKIWAESPGFHETARPGATIRFTLPVAESASGARP